MSIYYGKVKVAGNGIAALPTTVTVVPSYNKSGVKIADIIVDSKSTAIYAPEPIVDGTLVIDQSLPVGAIVSYAARTYNPPAGWLFCDGSKVKLSTYPQLFEVIGHTYKGLKEPGSDEFYLPSLNNGSYVIGNTYEKIGATTTYTVETGVETPIVLLNVSTTYIIKCVLSTTGKSPSPAETPLTQELITFDMIYPVGSIYTTMNSTNACPLPKGQWIRIASGRCLFGETKTLPVGTLISSGLPKPQLSITGSTSAAGGHSHNITYQIANCSCGCNGGIRSSHHSNNTGTLESSSIGDHTHAINISGTIADDAVYGKSTVVLPPCVIVVFWQRIA